MKNVLILFMSLVLVVGCSSKKKELYKETDSFVESLSTNYESYGPFVVSSNSKTTSDELYTVTPIGRLINVKIQKVVSYEEYEKLRKDIEKHYKKDKRVKDVYICKAGTIMIDCRN